MVWRLLAAGEKRLAAAAPYYGPFPEGGDLRGAGRGARRSTAGSTRASTRRASGHRGARGGRLPHEIVTFTEANHAFFNNTGANFNPPAAEEAYRRTFAWFDKFVAEGHDGRARKH